jgi:methionine-rich copper-binding protein CopC
MRFECRPSIDTYTERVIRPLTQLSAWTLSAGLVLFSAQGALAHNNVVETTPAAGDTVAESPVEVSLTTLEILLDLGGRSAGFAMVTRDAAGLYYGTGCLELSDNSMTTTVELGEPGEYEVIFQLVGADGHTISDRWSFTYTPAAGYTAAPGQSSPPVCGEEPEFGDSAPSSDETPSPTIVEPTDKEEDSTPGAGTLIAGSVAALAAIGAISAVLIRRKRS